MLELALKQERVKYQKLKFGEEMSTNQNGSKFQNSNPSITNENGKLESFFIFPSFSNRYFKVINYFSLKKNTQQKTLRTTLRTTHFQ